MKQVVLSTVLAFSFASGSVLAGQTSQQDMEMIFANKGMSVNAQELSQREMVETEGEWFNFAGGLVGGISGGSSYVASAGNGFGWGSFFGSVGFGAGAGFVNPVYAWPAGSSIGITAGIQSNLDSRASSWSWWR